MSQHDAIINSLLADGQESLFSRMVDGSLTDDQWQAVQDRLQQDFDFRTRYLQWSILDSDLEAIFEEESAPSLESHPLPRRWNASGPAAIVTGIALGLLIAVAFLLNRGAGRNGIEPVDRGRIAVRETGPGTADSGTFGSLSASPLAIVVGGEGLANQQAEEFRPGSRLGRGAIHLESGRLLLTFLGGATVLMEGPAQLVLESRTDARLVQGRISVRDAESAQARRFRLNVPEALIVDLGTEFAVETDSRGTSQLQVHEGEVSVCVLDQKGESQISDILRAKAGMLIKPRDAVPLQFGPADGTLSRVPGIPRKSLAISESYVAAVRQSRPLVYWRFDAVDAEGMIPDQGTSNCRGRIVGSGGEPSPNARREVAFVLNRGPSSRSVESERDLPSINRGDLSVELWAQTSEVSHQTVFALVRRTGASEQAGAAVLEFAHDSHLVHGPMAIRALSRTPPGRDGGRNLFAENLWMPGAWHHLVLVRSADRFRLYVDGQLVGDADYSTSEVDETPYRIVLGQLRPDYRQLIGELDEFAIYDRALTSAEVAEHHRLGTAREPEPSAVASR